MNRRSPDGESRRDGVTHDGLSDRFRPPAATLAKRILRVGAIACGVAFGSLALTASCSSSTPATTIASDATAASDAMQCPLPSPDPNRCSGDDPGFVFSPPLECEPSRREASAASEDGGDGGDPCDGLTNILSVFFSTSACQAFVAAETSGKVASDTAPGAPVFAQPSDGDMLTSDAWSIFVWSTATRPTRGAGPRSAPSTFSSRRRSPRPPSPARLTSSSSARIARRSCGSW